MTKRIYSILISIYMLCACESTPKITYEEYLPLTERNYSNVTKNQVIEAAKQLLYKAHGEKFIFKYDTENNLSTNVIYGHLNWGHTHIEFYIPPDGIGSDTWKITATEKDGFIYSTVELFRVITRPFKGIASAPYTREGLWAEPKLLHLFWSRMDYLLGQRDDWITYKDYNKEVTMPVAIQIASPLCYSSDS